jgi:uncharacterized membrane protein
MAEKYNTPKTPTPGKEESQVLTAKYTPIPEIAAGMIGMAQVIEQDARKQTGITNDEIMKQLVGSVFITFGQSITGELYNESPN